jgi:hypothetical protein
MVVALLVAGATVAVGLTRHSSPPVRASEAGLNGDVWVMPGDEVAPFLQRHGVTGGPPSSPETAVVARVAWTPRPGSRDEYFTVMLGDEKGRSGIIYATYGPPEDHVSLGNGSMWQHVLRKHDWLAGDGDFHVAGGYTSYARFASVPSDWTGDVWVVGRVVDPASASPVPDTVQDPQPVVGVALSRRDHTWWVQEVAR